MSKQRDPPTNGAPLISPEIVELLVQVADAAREHYETYSPDLFWESS